MNRQRLESEFERIKTEVLRENGRDLPGEARYFLTHERRFFHDAASLGELGATGRVLEIGAYPFFLTAILKGLGHAVVGVDLHPERAASLIRRQGLAVVACNVERQRLPFADASFDCVLFNEILEHLRIDPLLALSEVHRVLRPEGLLLLTTPNLYFVKTLLRFLVGRGLFDPVAEFAKLRGQGHMGHIREYAKGEVLRFLLASGFQMRRHDYAQFNYPAGLPGRAARPLLALLPMLRGDQCVVAKKVGNGPGLTPL